MAAKSAAPAKDIALLALQASDAHQGDMLEEVLTYCFDQLCWRRSTPDLVALTKRLDALIAEEV